MSDSKSHPQFTSEQLADIAAAEADVTAFAKRRAVEAIIKSDEGGYNAGLNKLLENSPSRFLDLLKMLITSEKEAKDTGKPTQAEALAKAGAAAPLKIQGRG